MADLAYETQPELRKPLEEQKTLEHFERRLEEGTEHSRKAWERMETNHRFLRGGKGQWKEADWSHRQTSDRPTLTINKTLNVVNNVAGREMTARYQSTFLGRGPGDGLWAEILREFYRKARQRGNFEQHESDQFRENVLGGLGCLEMRQDLTRRPWGKGRTIIEGVPAWEMIWGVSRERNFEDRMWDARGRWITWEELYALFPEHDTGSLDDLVQDRSAWVPPEAEKTHRWPWLYVGEGTHTRPRRREVFLIDYCWRQREWKYLIDPEANGQFRLVSKEQLRALGVPPNVPQVTWVVKQANIVGKEILREKALPFEHLPRFFLTGYPYKQEEEVEFFGLVDVMQDPQRFNNLVTSMSVSFMQHMAKGPMLYEPSAFMDIKEAQKQLATPNPHIALQAGGLDKLKFVEPPRYPDFIDSYLRHADDALYRPVGLDQTALGNIPDPRRVSGTVLQSVQESVSAAMSYLFDSLRLHRRSTALHFLEMMQEHYDVGDVARVVGEERAQNIPPRGRWEEMMEFDVIIEEEAVTRSEKQRSWQFFTNTDVGMNLIAGGMMPPEIMAEVAPDLTESQRQRWLEHLRQMQAAPSPEGGEGEAEAMYYDTRARGAGVRLPQ